MLTGKILGEESGKYALELSSGELFRVSAQDLPEQARKQGAEVVLSFSALGAFVEPQQVRDAVNYLLGIQ